MNDQSRASGLLLLGMLVVLGILAVVLVVMGSYPIGIALMAVAIALLPNSIRAVRVHQGRSGRKD